nr:flagellar hook protein [Opitutaceae bacterium]
GDGGILKTQRDALTKANTSLDAQIEVLERRVEQQRELLEAAFQRMNEYQTKMSSTSKLLDQLYNSSSKDDS